MNKMIIFGVAFGMLALGVSALLPSAAAQQDVDGVPVVSPPDFEAFQYLGYALDHFQLPGGVPGDVDVYLHHDVREKSIVLEWVWGESDPDFPEPLIHQETTHHTSYWPTSARYLGNNKVAVAGKSAVNGRLVIEVWTLANPNVIVIDGATTQYFLRAGVISEKRTAFVDPETGGIGLVNAMWRNRGRGDENVLVQSLDSRVVFSIDLATGGAARAVAPASPVGLTQAEPLLQPFWPAYAGPYRHASLGDLYAFTTEDDVKATGPEIHTLYLVDSNKDGVIDSSLAVTWADEEGLGLQDASLWED